MDALLPWSVDRDRMLVGAIRGDERPLPPGGMAAAGGVGERLAHGVEDVAAALPDEAAGQIAGAVEDLSWRRLGEVLGVPDERGRRQPAQLRANLIELRKGRRRALGHQLAGVELVHHGREARAPALRLQPDPDRGEEREEEVGGPDDPQVAAHLEADRHQPSRRSRRIGRSRTRTPVACQTALATAAAVPTMPISPIPLAPIGLTSRSSSSIQAASRSAMSAFVATWYCAKSWLR